VIVRVVARNFPAAQRAAQAQTSRVLYISCVWMVPDRPGERAYTFRTAVAA
jgi:hypothetical protein